LVELGLFSAQSVFLHGIQTTTTDIPPESFQLTSPTAPDPEKIVWIIILTLLLFAIGVAGIVELQRRCQKMHFDASEFAVSDDPSQPPTVASVCCPCLALESNSQLKEVREFNQKTYLKAEREETDRSRGKTEKSAIELRKASPVCHMNPKPKSSRVPGPISA
jgi:hypothetical protein